jgi:large subunit ribosomal protein L47
MLSSLRTRTSNAVRALGHVRRYSTPIEATPKAVETPGTPGALRPHLNIPVNPNHGLYAFFRKREKDGKAIYDSLEDDSGLHDVFGESRCPCFVLQPLTWALSRPSLDGSRAPEKKL